MKKMILYLIEAGARRGCIERVLKKEFQLQSINSITFKSLMADVRQSAGLIPNGDEVEKLVNWLEEDIRNNSAFYRIGLDEDGVCNKIIYLHDSMISEFRRNGQLIICDCTCKTNRLGWPLFIIVGIDQFLHTRLLCAAIHKHEDIISFEWILNTLRRAVGEDAWKNIRSVMSDGDSAFLHAVANCIPHAKQLRCRWHIYQNITLKLESRLRSCNMRKDFIDQYHVCVYSSEVDKFDSAWEELERIMAPYPDVHEYMIENIYSTRQHWSSAWTDKCVINRKLITSFIEPVPTLKRRGAPSSTARSCAVREKKKERKINIPNGNSTIMDLPCSLKRSQDSDMVLEDKSNLKILIKVNKNK
jgi:hypothetical protein